MIKPNKVSDWPETLYSFRLDNRANLNTLEVAKWQGGKQPEEVYSISNGGQGRCSCFGALRQPYCKHKRMVDQVNKLIALYKLPNAIGCYYDADRDLLYTPEDGEGVGLINYDEVVASLFNISTPSTEIEKQNN